MAVYYLHGHMTVEGQRTAVKSTVRALKHYGPERFDAIAFRGLSGSLVAPAVAYLINKPLIAVRKGEYCHSTQPAESSLAGRVATCEDNETHCGPPVRYVVVDDLVCSGRTLAAISDAVDLVHPGSTMLVCVVYNDVHHNGEMRVGARVVPVLGVQQMVELAPSRLRDYVPQELPCSQAAATQAEHGKEFVD